jgi:hypothetical protein
MLSKIIVRLLLLYLSATLQYRRETQCHMLLESSLYVVFHNTVQNRQNNNIL